jgi:hypothetical protein
MVEVQSDCRAARRLNERRGVSVAQASPPNRRALLEPKAPANAFWPEALSGCRTSRRRTSPDNGEGRLPQGCVASWSWPVRWERCSADTQTKEHEPWLPKSGSSRLPGWLANSHSTPARRLAAYSPALNRSGENHYGAEGYASKRRRIEQSGAGTKQLARHLASS